MPDITWPVPEEIKESACDLNAMRAIGKLLAGTARNAARTAGANKTIDLAPLLKPWRLGKYTVGDVIIYDGVPYKCLQEHDSSLQLLSAENENSTPAYCPELWAPCHATDRAHALSWKSPMGVHDAYQTGEWMVWTDGFTYRCKQDAIILGPDALPDAWEKLDADYNDPPSPEQTIEELLLEMAGDHEYRLCMIELGVTENDLQTL